MQHAFREIGCDVAVIGGGTGGCAAALAALRNGMRVVLTEETDWVGGQMTSQAVPPDEHRWIEAFGATRSYRRYREGVRNFYLAHTPLVRSAQSRVYLNPGNSWVSRLAHEPRISLAVLESMLAPYQPSGQLSVLRRHHPVRADVLHDRVTSVMVRDCGEGIERAIHARSFLDATETGELLPMTGAEHVVGSESRDETGEPHASEHARPANVQAFTWCFAIDHVEGEDRTIAKPAQYSFWREYVPALAPAWPGRLLDWAYSHPIDLAPRTLPFDPDCDRRGTPGGLWTYRRIVHRRNFEGSAVRDVTLVNWPQNDYWLGNLWGPDGDRHREAARQLSLSLLYWMQTEAPRPDGKLGWPGLGLRSDVFGTADGLAKAPYVRESRRIRAEFTVLEQHVGVDARREVTGSAKGEVTAQSFADSAGIGSYRIDLHPSTGGDNYVDIASLPFQIPLGALIPVRIENLLPAAKSLGVTHVTNGCFRLHPVEWNIGEAAGALAAFSVRTGHSPRAIRNVPVLLNEFQSLLIRQGVELEWPPQIACRET